MVAMFVGGVVDFTMVVGGHYVLTIHINSNEIMHKLTTCRRGKELINSTCDKTARRPL